MFVAWNERLLWRGLIGLLDYLIYPVCKLFSAEPEVTDTTLTGADRFGVTTKLAKAKRTLECVLFAEITSIGI